MSATVSTSADASAISAPGGRMTRHKGQVVSLSPSAPQLLDVRAVAEMLGCSTRHVYRMSDAAKMPSPLRLNSLVRWSQKSIVEWIDSGCLSCRKGGRR